jgi:TetR/AcrR family acrAB operon transcriptional repressor
LARKTKEEAQETREKLLGSALEVMSERPFSKVSMSDIAERVGLSKGALYWHFKNKNDLLVHLLEYLFSGVERELYKDYDPPKTFLDLRHFFKRKLEITMNSGKIQKMNKLFHRRLEWPDGLCERVIDTVRGMQLKENAVVTRIITRSRERGEIESEYSPEEISVLLSAMMHGFFFIQIHDIYMVDLPKYVDFFFDMLEKALEPKPRAGDGGHRQNIHSERDGVTLL